MRACEHVRLCCREIYIYIHAYWCNSAPIMLLDMFKDAAQAASHAVNKFAVLIACLTCVGNAAKAASNEVKSIAAVRSTGSPAAWQPSPHQSLLDRSAAPVQVTPVNCSLPCVLAPLTKLIMFVMRMCCCYFLLSF